VDSGYAKPHRREKKRKKLKVKNLTEFNYPLNRQRWAKGERTFLKKTISGGGGGKEG